MRVCLYCRVSTEEQARHGLSMGAQLDALRKFATAHQYNVVGEFADEGISARCAYKKRPALMKLLDAVERDEVDLILFCKLDRWFRNVAAYYQVQPFLDAHHVAWQAIHEDYETITASGRMKVNIMLSVAENEADRTSERIRFVFDSKRERGEVTSGSVALGFKIVNKRLAVDEETMPIVRDMFKFFIDVRSLTDTRNMLEHRYGLHRSYSGVKKMLTNKKYLNPVGRDTFVKVQELLASASTRRPVPKRVYLFQGIIYCRECGSRMISNAKGARMDIYYLCSKHHQYHDEYCANKKYYNEKSIESFLLNNIIPAINDYNASIVEAAAPTVDTEKIKKKMAKLKDLYLDDLITKDVYEADYRRLQKELETPLFAPKTVSVESCESILEKYRELSKTSQKALWGRILRRIECDGEGNIFLVI